MHRNVSWYLILTVLLAALASPARAQAINIDIGPEGTGPGQSYRGAGLPGHWHSFEAVTWGVFHDLLDVYGNATGARVRQIGGTEIVDATFGGHGLPEGGDAVLLGDALITHQIENCLFFEGLTNGTYELISYAWMPTAPATPSRVWVDFHPDAFEIGGAWPGRLAEGVIYARHEFTVTDGTINMHSGIPQGQPANPGAALNGVQLRLLGAEPVLFMARSAVEWLVALNATNYDVVRGDLGTLRAGGGDFTAATEGCLSNDFVRSPGPPAGPWAVPWAADPSPGQGQWLLVRGGTGFGAMTWNAPGSTQIGDRDTLIGPAAAGCP